MVEIYTARRVRNPSIAEYIPSIVIKVARARKTTDRKNPDRRFPSSRILWAGLPDEYVERISTCGVEIYDRRGNLKHIDIEI